MAKLEIGDKIKCINCGAYNDLIEGKIYTVKDRYFPLTGELYVFIKNEKGYTDFYHENLFKKILFNFTKKRLLK